MNLPIPAPHHAVANRNALPAPLVEISAGRPKFLPTHWPLPEVRVRHPALLAAPIEEPTRNRWPGVALKILAVALCYALVRDVEAAEPLSLRYGEPQVLSALGDPVDIRIPILSKEVNPDARFILGQQEGSTGLPTLRHANIHLERDRQGWSLRIQSTRRSTDPAMAVVVQEVVGGGMVSRTLPVLFDPTPVNAPMLQVAEADTANEPVRLGATGESWWTSAVVDKRAAATVAATTAPPQWLAKASMHAVEPTQNTNEPARHEKPNAVSLKHQHTIASSPSQAAPRQKFSAPSLAAANDRRWKSDANQEKPALRLAVALSDQPGAFINASSTNVDRESLRWLQRGMLGAEDRAAMLALSRKVVQLTAQLDSLEQRLSDARSQSGPAIARQESTPATSKGKGSKPAERDAAESAPPLKLSGLMTETSQRGNPWGLPLLAGLMLGAGYWSGRRTRGEQS